jgi:hypothetical protein
MTRFSWVELLLAMVNREQRETVAPQAIAVLEPRDPVANAVGGMTTPRPDLDEVNDASFDSFPASDAPAWSSMHAGAPS